MSINRLPDLHQATLADHNHISFLNKSVFSADKDNSFGINNLISSKKWKS